jgi:hypothetical protein
LPQVREELAMRMGGFKGYLETRGAELARTGQVAPQLYDFFPNSYSNVFEIVMHHLI